MPAPQEVLDLVARFEENLAAYTSGVYNEAQLRREFIDPLFSALGWDLDNVAGHAEAYKDVIHEAAIRIGGAMKAPDYCFRIGGTRKFFVEAKSPPSAPLRRPPPPTSSPSPGRTTNGRTSNARSTTPTAGSIGWSTTSTAQCGDYSLNGSFGYNSEQTLSFPFFFPWYISWSTR